MVGRSRGTIAIDDDATKKGMRDNLHLTTIEEEDKRLDDRTA